MNILDFIKERDAAESMMTFLEKIGSEEDKNFSDSDILTTINNNKAHEIGRTIRANLSPEKSSGASILAKLNELANPKKGETIYLKHSIAILFFAQILKTLMNNIDAQGSGKIFEYLMAGLLGGTVEKDKQGIIDIRSEGQTAYSLKLLESTSKIKGSIAKYIEEIYGEISTPIEKYQEYIDEFNSISNEANKIKDSSDPIKVLTAFRAWGYIDKNRASDALKAILDSILTKKQPTKSKLNWIIGTKDGSNFVKFTYISFEKANTAIIKSMVHIDDKSQITSFIINHGDFLKLKNEKDEEVRLDIQSIINRNLYEGAEKIKQALQSIEKLDRDFLKYTGSKKTEDINAVWNSLKSANINITDILSSEK